MIKNTLQLLTPSSLPVGAAFLAGDDLILTCAHVVMAAGSAPGEKISLRTPSGTLCAATVESETWRDENHEDIATLRLDEALTEMQALPLGASSASKGHSFSTYGFPKPDQALSGSGTITGRATIKGIELLQLESAQVTPGFSGAPVFDEVTKRVIGMVVAIAPPDEYQRQGTTAFAIPTETLRAACPELRLSEICPYRSLDAFTEADAHLFFGRERVITKLLESLKRNPRFLAVLGPSGSGKSSVVQAGLIPALRQGNLLGSERWGILSIRPGTQPFEQLASLGMSEPAANLVKSVSDWLAAHPKNERLLILIDQFEELLVSTPANLRAEFIAALANLLDSSADVSIVLTLRDDFFGRFAQDAELLMGWMERAQINIPGTLEEGELREMIERPARDLGLRFASGLVDAILADARTADPSGRSIRSTILPLLEFALTQLWESREDGELTHETYRAMGGVTGGLSQWADRAYYALDGAERALAQRIFSELVTLGDETQGIADTRRVRNLDELIAIDDAIAEEIIAKLVTARLLVTRHDDVSGADTVEIIHETLLREWGLLGQWLQDDRAFLLWRESLRAAQQAWKESGFDNGALLRGAPLAEAEDWLEKRGDDLGAGEREFIESSVALRKRGERNRRWVMVGLAFVALVMAGLAFWGSSEATNAQDQAITARARELSTKALYYIAEKPDLAYLLSVEAFYQHDDPQTRGSLFATLHASPIPFRYLFSCRGSISDIAFNPNEKILAISCYNGEILLWDMLDLSVITRLEPQDGNLRSITYSLNENLLVAVYAENTIVLWDLSDPISPVKLSTFEDEKYITNVAISPNGKILAITSSDFFITIWDISDPVEWLQLNIFKGTHIEFRTNEKVLFASEDGKIHLWDVSYWDVPNQISVFDESPSSVAFSKDGNLLALGDRKGAITLWNVSNLTEPSKLATLIGHSVDRSILSIAFSLDNNILASGGEDGAITLWDISDENSPVQFQVLNTHTRAVVSVIFYDENTLLSESIDNSVIVWDIANMLSIDKTINLPAPSVPLNTRLSFNSKGNVVVLGGGDEPTTLWDISDMTAPTLLHTFFNDNNNLVYTAFSSNGSIFASLHQNNNLKLWDVEKPNVPVQEITFDKRSNYLAFSPTGKMIATVGWDGTVILWDTTNQYVPTHQISTITEKKRIIKVAFDMEGKILALGNDDGSISMWNISVPSTPVQLYVSTEHTGIVTAIAFNPSGTMMASIGNDSDCFLWDISDTNEPLIIDKLPLSMIWGSGLSFSADGRFLAVSGCIEAVSELCDYGGIYVWDVYNHDFLFNQPMLSNGFPLDMVISSDNKTLISGSSTGDITKWNISPSIWASRVCEVVGRNFTQSEWQQYFPDEEYRLTCPQWPAPEDALATMED